MLLPRALQNSKSHPGPSIFEEEERKREGCRAGEPRFASPLLRIPSIFHRALNFLAAALALSCAVPAPASAQWFAHPRMKPADELIHKQDPPRTTPRVLDTIAPDKSNVAVIVNIPRQRVYLMVGDEIGID